MRLRVVVAMSCYVLATLVLAAGAAGAQPWSQDPVVARTMSNRADLIFSGDVLIEVPLPAHAEAGTCASRSTAAT